MTTERVHTTDNYDVYCGRGDNGELDVAKAVKEKRMTEVGAWGNPYKLNDYGREKAIELYERDLEILIEEKSWFREALKSLYGKKLGCYCADHQKCHVDVLVSKVNKLYWEEYEN